MKLGYLGGCAESDVFAEWIGPKAASAADVAVDGALFASVDEFCANLGTDGRAI